MFLFTRTELDNKSDKILTFVKLPVVKGYSDAHILCVSKALGKTFRVSRLQK